MRSSRVEVVARGGVPPDARSAARRAAEDALRTLGLAGAGLAILLTDDRGIAVYHERWFGDPSATDVISFGAGEDPQGAGLLGDIVISAETASRRARELGTGPAEEIALYVIHGILHLIGMDHATDGGRMRRAEARLYRRVTGRPLKRAAR